jgi:hypothetical protein
VVLTGVNEITNPSDMLFIIERVNEGLNTAKLENGDIVMEGVCAVFDTKNNNNRIYEKAEYLPHLEYLNEKIEKGQLFGELDHPQNFDVSLKNVSHVVEKLWYDQGSNNVKIKVRLLNTPAGQIAKTLVESGCTISTSSRAAGQVMNEGKVKIQRIFTYDLVAEPGFSEAVLRRSVNESFQSNYSMLFESLDNIKSTSIINTLVDISESLNLEESIKVYKINNEEIVKTMENNNKHMTNEFVTKEAFNQYSELVKGKFDSLKESVDKLVDGFAVTEEDQEEDPTMVDPNAEEKEEEASATNDQLVEYVNYLSSELGKVIEYNNYLSGMLNKSINYSEHVAEKVNKVIDYSDYLAEKVEQGIGYSEYVGENLNNAIDYSEHIAENVNKNIKYTEYLAENVDKGIQYTEYVAEKSEQGIRYTEYIGENLKHSIGYANYLAENLEKGIKYSEYIATELNEGKAGLSAKAASAFSQIEKLDESVNYQVSEGSDVSNIVTSVNSIVKHIKDNSAKAVLENRYPFLKLLNEDNKSRFFNLDQAQKTAIIETLSGAVYFKEADVLQIIESVLNKQQENVPNLIKFMPAKFKEVFESMTPAEKSRLEAQASLTVLNTPYQVKNFWESRDLRGVNERIYFETQNKNAQHINESQGREGFISIEKVAEHQRGYGNAYLDALKRRAQN